MRVRTLLIILGVIVVAGGAYVAWRKLRPVTVSVVNGFDIPIKVTVGDKQIVVPANRYVSVRRRCRPCTVIVTTESGAPIDRQELDPAGEHIVFNPLGASVLRTVGQLYSVHGITSYDPSPATEYWFMRVVEPTGVDYYFVAPDKVALTTTKGPTEKRIFRQGGGWASTALRLLDDNREQEATKLLELAIALQGENQDSGYVQRRLAERHPAPGPERKTPGDDWFSRSADNEVHLSQRSHGQNKCDVVCQRANGENIWTADICMAKDADARFVAPDCSRAIIVRKNVAYVYDHSTLVETRPDVTNPRMAPDGHHVEFSATDGRTDQLILYR